MDDRTSEMATKSDETLQFSQFAMDNASVDIYWLGCDARIHYVNKHACNTLGYSKEELLQLSIPDIDPLFSMEQWSQHWERLKIDRTQTFTTRHRRKNGEVFAVEVTANYVQYGQLEYNVAYTRNITEQINREDAIKESERRSKELISNLQVGVIIQTAHAEIISNNRIALDLLGLTEEQLLGKTSFDPDWSVIHEDGTPFPGYTHPVPLAIATRKSVINVVMGVNRPSIGDRVWLLVSATPQLNSDGSVAQVVCTFVDYTERKLAEIELEQIRTQLMEAQKIANLGSFEYVVATRTTIWSEEEYRIYGLDPLGPSPEYAELLDKFIHPDDVILLNDTFIKAMESSSIYEFEHRIVRPDGHERWVFDRAVPYFDGDGKKLLRYIGTTLDITDRKQNEELINRLAYYDTLTELPNRRMLNDRLKQAMAANRRSGIYGAVLFMDLDNFKPLNDAHGHTVGDLLLISVGQRLRNCVREMDTVARFGGDEFVVMLSELDKDEVISKTQALMVAEKIRSCLAETYTLKLQQEDNSECVVEHNCSSSIGVTLFHDHDISVNEVFRQADAAMYQAKTAGRNSIKFYAGVVA